MRPPVTVTFVAMLACCLGCRSAPKDEPWPPPFLREFPSPAGRILLRLTAAEILAVNDTVPIAVTRERCYNDVCLGLSERWSANATWAVDRPGVVTLLKGQVIARRPGRAWITTTNGDTVLRRSVQVIAPVGRFRWEPELTHARVGDTIRVRAVARDSTGHVIAVIPTSGREGGEDSAPLEILVWGGPDGTILVPSGPGRLVLRATLGRRSAVLRILIDNR